MEKILTLHPAGKRGVHIDFVKYNFMKEAIVSVLSKSVMLTHAELSREVKNKLPRFEGSIDWYLEAVKLDLEARKIIARIYTMPEKYKII